MNNETSRSGRCFRYGGGDGGWSVQFVICSLLDTGTRVIAAAFPATLQRDRKSLFVVVSVEQVKSSQVAFNEWVWQSHKLTIKIQYMINVQTQKNIAENT